MPIYIYIYIACSEYVSQLGFLQHFACFMVSSVPGTYSTCMHLNRSISGISIFIIHVNTFVGILSLSRRYFVHVNMVNDSGMSLCIIPRPKQSVMVSVVFILRFTWSQFHWFISVSHFILQHSSWLVHSGAIKQISGTLTCDLVVSIYCFIAKYNHYVTLQVLYYHKSVLITWASAASTASFVHLP